MFETSTFDQAEGWRCQDWEWLWAPYDEPTYQAVLEQIRPDDRVLEIGAGDLRLARRIAVLAQHVIAVEIQAALLNRSTEKLRSALPGNLEVIQGDARCWPFPHGITLGVLLMRHCNHFHLYLDKLKEIGAQRLITNARWRMGVEVIDLAAPRSPYDQVPVGWFACWCGNTGFIPGPPEQVTLEVINTGNEVIDCPACKARGRTGGRKKASFSHLAS